MARTWEEAAAEHAVEKIAQLKGEMLQAMGSLGLLEDGGRYRAKLTVGTMGKLPGRGTTPDEWSGKKFLFLQLCVRPGD